jgi:hypothetical protein
MFLDIKTSGWVLLASVPLAIWKLIDIVVWLIKY